MTKDRIFELSATCHDCGGKFIISSNAQSVTLTQYLIEHTLQCPMRAKGMSAHSHWSVMVVET